MKPTTACRTSIPDLYDPALTLPLFNSGWHSSARYQPAALGTSPNPILARLQFYLNGIGIAGQTAFQRVWWTITGKLSVRAWDLPMT